MSHLTSIRTCELDGETLYSLWDACKLLGHRFSAPVNRGTPIGSKKTVRWEIFGEVGPRAKTMTTALTLVGLKHVVATSRRAAAWDLAVELGIELVYAPLPEAETLRVIRAALDPVEFIEQYRVGAYVVDAYLPGLGFVIECDENGHESYDPVAEHWREDFIRDQLQCEFIRYNPSQAGFNIGSVINQLLTTPLPAQFASS
jgi:very-short-patch-repair endonuclease